MLRREFLAAAAALQAQPAARPNVLFIIADDLNTDVASYGVAGVKTPHLDRLGRQGVRFDRAYCQYPLCNPSRTSFLSGRRPETTGVQDQRTILRQKDPKVEFLPDFFRRHGYFTAGAGKVFHHGKPNSAGFEVWEPAEFTGGGEAAARKRRYANPEGNRTPDWAPLDDPEESTGDASAARHVNGWMERAAGEGKPFFVVAGFQKPHLPWAVPRSYFDLYPKVEVAAVPEFTGIPKHALVTELGASKPPEPRWQAVAAYRAATTYMDAQVGKLLGTLDRLQLWNNTVVVMIGDNGFHLGEHHLWSKHKLFERATRVPMYVAAPGVKGGAVCRRTVELLDVYPTMAGLARLPAPSGLEGANLKPLLDRPGAGWDRAARSVVRREGISGASVRTERWRYVEWDKGAQGAELYDHSSDEGEYKNLAGSPAHAATVRQLKSRLSGGGRLLARAAR